MIDAALRQGCHPGPELVHDFEPEIGVFPVCAIEYFQNSGQLTEPAYIGSGFDPSYTPGAAAGEIGADSHLQFQEEYMEAVARLCLADTLADWDDNDLLQTLHLATAGRMSYMGELKRAIETVSRVTARKKRQSFAADNLEYLKGLAEHAVAAATELSRVGERACDQASQLMGREKRSFYGRQAEITTTAGRLAGVILGITPWKHPVEGTGIFVHVGADDGRSYRVAAHHVFLK